MNTEVSDDGTFHIHMVVDTQHDGSDGKEFLQQFPELIQAYINYLDERKLPYTAIRWTERGRYIDLYIQLPSECRQSTPEEILHEWDLWG